MNFVHVVAALAVLQFLVFGVLVGRARGQYGVRAPATTGHELFERAFRAHMNTLEQLVAFLPALALAALYWSAPLVAGIGAVYLVGRVVYWRAYSREPKSRGLGFLLTVAPTVVLLLMALVGAVRGGAVV